MTVNFILHFAKMHIGSSIRYENTLFENYIFNGYIVKRILISFNCFSEYICNIFMNYLDNEKIITGSNSKMCDVTQS